MDANLRRGLQRLTRMERRKRRRRTIVTALAAVMVFCTTYALILPALTLEHSCGIPEHQHTEECLASGPSCTYRAHRHAQDCYDGSGALSCGEAGFVVHRHDVACYDASGKLRCSLPEIEVHTHSTGCYAQPAADEKEEPLPETTTEPEPAAEPTDPVTEETPAAEETSADLPVQQSAQSMEEPVEAAAIAELARPAEPVPVCGKPEIQLHEHTDACRDANGALVCGKLEVLEHRHTEACLTQGGDEPICGLEEHNHAKDDVSTLTEEEQAQAKAVEAQIAALPDIKDGQEKLEQTAENAAARALYRRISDVLAAARKNYDALTDGQKKAVSNAEKMIALEKAWAEVKAPALEALQDDAAFVAELSVSTGMLNEPKEATAARSVQYVLSMKLSPYRAEDEYGAANVRIECVLPLTAEQAAFDLAQMSWLENAAVAAETCEWNGVMQPCQVLAGTYRLSGKDGAAVIPGEYTEPIVVALQKTAPGASLSLQISAALEQNTWDGVCAAHGTAEKRTVTTAPMIVRAELTEEEMQQIGAQFAAEIEVLETTAAQEGEALSDETMAAIEALRVRLEEALALGELTEESFTALIARLDVLLYGSDLNSIAEPAVGTNWMLLRNSGWFEEYSSSACAVQKEAVRMPSLAVAAQDSTPSGVQVNNPGGETRNDEDGVAVSKTIAGTELENVFDITLRVRTSQRIEEVVKEPDMAVVIVMDISNTMNSKFGNSTRYKAAMDAAEQFLDHFAENNSLGISKVGYVAFNTDAHKIFDLQACANRDQTKTLKNIMRTQTGNIINASGYNGSHSRFTNIEAGLKLAQDMLSGAANQNKFIIFLSDGFPTTYISSGYFGYDPYDSAGERFRDHVLNKPCAYGTSYSDEAAIRAGNMAHSIKDSGTTIFSVGVDVGGQTIQQYIAQSEKANGFSVVDRTGTTYEIGDATSTEAYKNWLRGSIGSGYYYDSTNAEGLKDAYNDIFRKIKETTQIGSEADWVASDPLPAPENVRNVEFIGLYDKNRSQCGDEVRGTHDESAENTAKFENDTIHWDLKNSGYTLQNAGDEKTAYTYELVYRVRLENEQCSFKEEAIYPTNDKTTLTYRIVSSTGVSDKKEIEFPIPSVHGYLGELEFTKRDNRGNALPGAVFTLSHDNAKCPVCRGDGKTSVSVPEQTATSGTDGEVSFTDIPSGHIYILKETTVPAGYAANGDTYRVAVAYDKVSVTVTHPDKTTGTWGENAVVVNNTYYELPSTGGAGTLPFTAGGLLIAGSAALLLAKYTRRRRENHTSF